MGTRAVLAGTFTCTVYPWRLERISPFLLEVGLIMMVLITYDVNTETAAGRKRLRRIAKQCVNYGQRVQMSVFECLLDAAQFRLLKSKLEEILDKEHDSLRFYYLGDNYKSRVEHIGAKVSIDMEGPLIL